jgi:hypothetical protein
MKTASRENTGAKRYDRLTQSWFFPGSACRQAGLYMQCNTRTTTSTSNNVRSTSTVLCDVARIFTQTVSTLIIGELHRVRTVPTPALLLSTQSTRSFLLHEIKRCSPLVNSLPEIVIECAIASVVVLQCNCFRRWCLLRLGL